jgi:hypothetical protein
MTIPTIPLDPYLIHTLMPDLVGHDRQPSAFLAYLHLWAVEAAQGGGPVAVSLQTLADGTGLSKRAVQSGLATLERRRLVAIRKRRPTDVASYTILRPWTRRSRP